ncbi:MAG: protein kinase [Pirellulaceae bacterium]|nr:protein kinase [Pirellulaceae bacterium]
MNRSLLDAQEDRIDAFERARVEDPEVALNEFLPPSDDDDYAIVAVELMRIDLESCWRQGTPKRLAEYQNNFANVLKDRELLSELAFEEYRCRLQSGSDVKPEEYVERFAISIDHWPLTESSTTDRLPHQLQETIDDLGPESDRLVNAIQRFPQPGDCFQDFQLLETLGQGTFGTVFRAKQAQLANRLVVLKISTGRSVEPQHLARLQHTHIVPIYSTHESDQLQAVCMPYFGRTTLADVVRSLKKLNRLPTSGQLIGEVIRARSDGRDTDDWAVKSQLESLEKQSYVDAVIQIMWQIVAGLEHAHQRGILHRDIKPANVLLTDDGRPMLLDFNVSDEIVVGGRACLMVGGTWPYMSPEQKRSMTTGHPIDQRSDIFSLGVLLYQLLCRQLPNPEESSEVGAFATPAGCPIDVPHIRDQNPLVPRSVAAVVCRCLQPDRERRYQTVNELKQDLECHLENRPLRFVADWSVTERAQKWCRRHPRILSASTISVVAAILLGVAASMAWIRDQQFQRAHLMTVGQTIDRELPRLRVLFGAHDLDAHLALDATERAQELIQQVDLEPALAWSANPLVRHFDRMERQELRDDLAELYFLLAAASVRQVADSTLSTDQLQRAQLHNQLAQRLFVDDRLPAALSEQQLTLEKLGQDEELTPTRQDLSKGWVSSGQRMMLAQQLMSQGDYVAAVNHFEQLRAADPFDFSSWFLLGNCYVSLERLSAADGCFTTCATLWPDMYLTWFNRGLCRFQSGEFMDAKHDFDRVLELQEDFAPALFNRALCQKRLRNFKAAIQDLTEVVRLQGHRPRTLLVRARVYDQLGENDLAEADRQKAFASAPVDAKGWMALGLARVEEDPQQALADIQRAQELMPFSAQVGRNLAFVYGEHLEQPEAAADVLFDLVQRFEDPTDRMARAVMLARMGNQALAVQEGQQALQLRRDGKLLFQMACVYALGVAKDSEQTENAVAYLAEAISIDPYWLTKAASDSDLDSIRRTDGFRNLVRAALVIQKRVQSNRSTTIPASN